MNLFIALGPSKLSKTQLNVTCLLHFCPDYFMEPWFPDTFQTDVTMHDTASEDCSLQSCVHLRTLQIQTGIMHWISPVWQTEGVRSNKCLELVRERNLTTKSKELDTVLWFQWAQETDLPLNFTTKPLSSFNHLKKDYFVAFYVMLMYEILCFFYSIRSKPVRLNQEWHITFFLLSQLGLREMLLLSWETMYKMGVTVQMLWTKTLSQ